MTWGARVGLCGGWYYFTASRVGIHVFPDRAATDVDGAPRHNRTRRHVIHKGNRHDETLLLPTQ